MEAADENAPLHVAIIPDGNRRWAKQRGASSIKGHQRGYEVTRAITKEAFKHGIRVVTWWGFSTENWKRASDEVASIMDIFASGIDAVMQDNSENKARFVHIGRKDRLSGSLARKLSQMEQDTAHYTDRFLVVAIDYGGRDELTRAVERLMSAHVTTEANVISSPDISQHLDTAALPHPEPDLIIRTGGEKRTSGFMIWQSAHSEWIFLDTLFPDFSEDDFHACLREYASRQRRLGK